MYINNSYPVGIINQCRIFKPTIIIYKNAVSYIVNIVEIHYSELINLKSIKLKQSHIEKLIHSTKNNEAKYKKFDKNFYKFPSYLRRSAISDAISIFDSYYKLLQLCEQNNKLGKKPKLRKNQNVVPVFYNKNMLKKINSNYEYMIKLYINNDWVWYPIFVRKTDMDYLLKHFNFVDLSAPSLVKSGRRYQLRFTVTTECTFSSKQQLICSVDLGLNYDAVCSIIKDDGTVIGRKFINHPIEKDHLSKILDEIRTANRNGNKKTPRLWRFQTNYNEAVAMQTAFEIIEFAASFNVDVVVFEYLDFKGAKKHGKNAQKLSLWRYKNIQNIAERLAHKHNIRFARICAINTSKLAYDGSGLVKRDANNYKICTFKNGKIYNCDLSASYNIGARYLIKMKLKKINNNKLQQVQAKVPELCKRTEQTLSTLQNLCSIM